MSYKEQKAQSMFNKWWAMNRALYVRDPDAIPPLIQECNSIKECYRWRETIMKEIGDKVAEIQNPGMETYKIRTLNDQINELLNQKRQWEKRIRDLGGPNLTNQEKNFLQEKYQIKGNYMYFGAAKELPGVKEIFLQKEKNEFQQDPQNIINRMNKNYFELDLDKELIEELQQEEERLKKKNLFKWIQKNADEILENYPNFLNLEENQMIQLIQSENFQIQTKNQKNQNYQQKENELEIKKKELFEKYVFNS